ncbi:MAG: hypothetical protein JNN28_20690, partial [Saprospiraceae bacterium]|nr:hypothetical protein [Saprospiraceae bacterium]
MVFLSQPFSASALDYYWVNGNGKWSEFATHWAKVPNPGGPSDFHANVPTANNDVYFTDNGGVAYTVDVDAGVTIPKCRNMDWTGVPTGTIWGGAGSQIDIYGSVKLDGNMSISFTGTVQLLAIGTMNTILSNGVHFPSGVLQFSGSAGGWRLLDDLYCDGTIFHNEGLLETQGHNITLVYSYYGAVYGTSAQLHLGSSEFRLLYGHAYMYYLPAQMDAGTSHIIIEGSGYGLFAINQCTLFDVTLLSHGHFAWGNVAGKLTCNDYVYIHGYNVPPPQIHEAVFKSSAHIYNAVDYKHLTLTAGKTYTIQDYTGITGTDQTLLPGGSFTALGAGTCSEFITLKSYHYGTSFNLVNNTGTDQIGHCMILEDCHATGANSLTVIDGVDLGNNTGWIFQNPHGSMDLYWVGGAGDWNDPCHWTTDPNGLNGDCDCIPNGATNVHFTANSGFAAGDMVNVPEVSYCADMDWTGVTGSPEFYHTFGSNNALHIYGSLTLVEDMTFDYGGFIRFRTDDVATITSARHDMPFYVVFEGTGTWELQDSFKVVNYHVYHRRGTFKSMGQPMLINYWWGNFRETDNQEVNMGAELYLGEPGGGNSDVWMIKSLHTAQKGHFRCWYETGKFHAQQSHIYGAKGAYIDCHPARYQDFWNVTYIPIDHAGDFLYGNILGKLDFQAFGNLVGPDSYIHEVEFHAGSYLFDSHTYDIMTIHGGHSFKFQPYYGQGNTIQTITAGGSFNHINTDCVTPTYFYNNGPEFRTTFRKEGAGTTFDIGYAIFDQVIPDLTTGAVYNATNCVAFQPDVESDWNITNPAPRTMYWVGGNGNWNDSNHWSLSSGGAGGECPPTAHDDVFFNANSGLNPGDAVTVNYDFAFCKNMDWTGVGNGAVFNNNDLIGNWEDPYSYNALDVFGNLKFSNTMVNDFRGPVFLRANTPATITSAGNHFKWSVYTYHPDGDWSLLDPFWTEWDLVHFDGKFRTNDQHVTIERFWDNQYAHPSAEAYLGNSIIDFLGSSPYYGYAFAFLYYPTGNFQSGTSTFNFANSYLNDIYTYGYNAELYNVHFRSYNSRLFGGNIKNKLIFDDHGSIYYASSGGYIHDVEFKGDAEIYDSRSYHKIKFAPGKRYTFNSGYNQTIVPFNGQEGEFNAAGLPGQYIEIKSSNINSPVIIHMDDSDGDNICTKYLFLTGMHHTGTEEIYVPTPGGNVFNNDGWLFFPCNPCPASIPVLDPLSITVGCPPGKARLILANLKPDEWANWYTDPDAMFNLVYSGGNLFEPDITGPTTYYARVYSDGGLCESTVVLTVPITTINPPQAYTVTGGGIACLGANIEVGLDDSDTGVEYQLKRDGINLGAPLPGTGSALNFGYQNVAGTYTVVANITGTGCPATMNGSAVISYDPSLAPTVIAGSNTPVCTNGPDLQLFESGGDAIAWIWTGPAGFNETNQNPTISNPSLSNSGDYTVEITGSNGCTNQATIQVQVLESPQTNSDCPMFACENVPGSGEAFFDLTSREDCITLGDNSLDVRYFTDPVLLNEILHPASFLSGTRIVYTLVTSNQTGCTVSGTMSLTVGLLPAPRLNPNSIIRVQQPGGIVTLIIDNLPPGYEAIWYADDQITVLYASTDNNFQIFVNQPTTFYGAVHDPVTGCISELLEIKTCLFDFHGMQVPFSSAPVGNAPGIKYAHTFGTGNGVEAGRMIIALPDSTYVMAGDAGSDCDPNGDIYLVKSNCAGDIIWQRAYGGPAHERISWLMDRALIQTPDGGFLIIGHTNSYGHGGLDNILIKTDSEGNQQWVKIYGGSSDEYSRGISATSDGGFLITDYSFSNFLPDLAIWGDIHLTKIDANGNEQWTKLYPKQGWQSPYVGIELPNGSGYLTAGTYGLTKVDLNGNEVWERPGVEGIGYVLEPTADGGIMYAGRKYAGADGFMWKLDGNGDYVWPNEVVIPGPSENYLYVTKEKANGNWVCAGEHLGMGAGNWDFWFFETDPNGNVLWERTFGGPGYEWATSMKETVDGDYIAIGLSSSYDNILDFLTVKLDIIPDGPPILDPASITSVQPGQQAKLILQNLPLGYAAVWYDSDQITELYADAANLFQPLMTHSKKFYAAMREIATGCESDKIEVLVCAAAVTIQAPVSVCAGDPITLSETAGHA